MRRRRRNISVYIDSTGSGSRRLVTHLLHLVEEGAKVENVSRYIPIISQAGGGMNLNKHNSNFFVTVVIYIFVKRKSLAKFLIK